MKASTATVPRRVSKRGRPVNSGWRQLPFIDSNAMDHIMHDIASTLPQLCIDPSDFFSDNNNNNNNNKSNKTTKKKVFRNQKRAPVPYAVLVGLALLNAGKPVPASVVYKFIEEYFPGCMTPKAYTWKSCVRQKLAKEPFVSQYKQPAAFFSFYALNHKRLDLFESVLHKFIARGVPVEDYGLKDIDDWNALQEGTKDLSKIIITHDSFNRDVEEPNKLPVVKKRKRVIKASTNQKASVSVGIQTEPSTLQNEELIIRLAKDAQTSPDRHYFDSISDFSSSSTSFEWPSSPVRLVPSSMSSTHRSADIQSSPTFPDRHPIFFNF